MNTMLVDKIANALRSMNWNEQFAFSVRAEEVCKAIGPAPQAADEMLETLREAVEVFEIEVPRGNPTIERMRNAIAKAEGAK